MTYFVIVAGTKEHGSAVVIANKTDPKEAHLAVAKKFREERGLPAGHYISTTTVYDSKDLQEANSFMNLLMEELKVEEERQK